VAEPLFFKKEEVLSFHSEQINLFGGSHGLRDEGLPESALASPENIYCWDEASDIFDLSAAYLHALANNHPFIDGNKRVAAASGLNFLKVNGLVCTIEPLYLAAFVQSLVTHSCDKKFVAECLFLGCFPEILEEAWRTDQTEPAPQSYFDAKSDEERVAIVNDYVTSKIRAGLIDACQQFSIRPDRFDALLEYSENRLFKKVAAE